MTLQNPTARDLGGDESLAASRASGAQRGRLLVALAWCAVLAGAIAGRYLLRANTDVSWLITLAEKLLDGARIYVDIVEPNPPMSIYLYLPSVALGRLAGMRPEPMLDLQLLLLGALSVVWSGRRLPEAVIAGGLARQLLAPAAFAVLVILPAVNFGQREHVALILFLPWLAIMIRRALGAPVVVGDAVFAGLAGGLVMAIKPHFALSLAAASAVAALGARSWRPIFAIENIVAGLVVVAYGGSVLLLHPSYGKDLGPMIQLYMAVRQPLWSMMFGDFPALALEVAGVCALLVATRGRQMLAPWIGTATAATVGFFAAAIIQGKGWPYHFYPALALTVLIMVVLAASRPVDRRPDIALAALAAAFFAQVWLWGIVGLDMTAQYKALAAIKAHPRVMAMAGDPAVSFPTTRAAGGVWADQAFVGWIPDYAADLMARGEGDREALLAMVEKARRALAADLRERRPDAILVQRRPSDYLEWARRDPELARLLSCFHAAARTAVGEPDRPGGRGVAIEIWAPNDDWPANDACLRAASARLQNSRLGFRGGP